MSTEETLAVDLLPPLIQCFGIIAIGYMFGQLQIIQNSSAKGLCIFLQYLSLPSLIFTSLATISFSNVNWQFLASILIAKSLLFIIVALSAMLLTKPIHLGKAGIYAIAATQSSDLALGYPLMASLYKAYNKDYPLVLYLTVPIQLLLLNPTGFFLLEVYKQVHDPDHSHKNKLLAIGKELLKNPIILMTILGMLYNIAFNHQQIPPSINKLLESLSNVFSGLALFLLGHGMSSRGKEHAYNHSVAPGFIVLAKLVVLPLLLQKTVFYLLFNASNSDLDSLSHLAFLYGVMPTATSAFIFSKQYEVAVQSITSITVYSTVFSAPLIFLSAALISLDRCCIKDFRFYLNQVTKYIGVLNLLCCIYIICAFVKRRQWSNICRTAVVYVATAQAIISVGAILLFFYDGNNMYIFYSGYILQVTGQFSTYMCAGILAAIIFVLRWRSLCYVLRYQAQVKLYGFIIPIGLSAVLALSLIGTRSGTTIECFHLGKAQYIVTFVITTISLVTIAILIALGHKCHIERQDRETEDTSSDEQARLSAQRDIENIDRNIRDCCNEPCNCINEISDDSESSSDVAADLSCVKPLRKVQKRYCSDMCAVSQNCSTDQQKRCSINIEKYEKEIANCDIDDSRSLKDYKKYITLLVYVCSSMLVSNAESLSEQIGIPRNAFLEVQFLNSIIKNGLGIVCFLIFESDYRKLKACFKAMWRFMCSIPNKFS